MNFSFGLDDYAMSMMVPFLAAGSLAAVYYVLMNRSTETSDQKTQNEKRDHDAGKRSATGMSKWISVQDVLMDPSNWVYNPTIVFAGETSQGALRTDVNSRFGTAPVGKIQLS